MHALKDAPGIVVLPPVLVGGALLTGIALHYTVWTVELMPVIIARPLGFMLFVAAGLLAHSAQLAMNRVGTNILPTQPTLAIVTDGPYRFTRNPLYIAALGVYLGVTLWVDGLVPLVLVLPVAWMLHWGIVLREERYLHAKFGATYEAYRSQVRRWL